MTAPPDVGETGASGWRMPVGLSLFALSIAVPAAGVPLVAASGLPGTMAATVSGGLLIGAEALGLLAVAVMGKPGFLYIKRRALGVLRRRGPPAEVGRRRYRAGLAMFCTPIVFAWLSPYAADVIPGFARDPLPYAIGGDLLLLASLFVLGGDFWDKVRALFVHADKIAPRE